MLRPCALTIAGNRFTIVLRDVDAPADRLEVALAALANKGFVNYFGLQRFGANAAAPTHEAPPPPSPPHPLASPHLASPHYTPLEATPR